MLSEEEIERMINACEHPRDKAMVACLYESGTRISELGALRKTYSETTVVQVLSGYVRDQNENIIAGTKVIITSTYSIGLGQMRSAVRV